MSRETRDYIDRRLSKDQNPELLRPDGRLTDWDLRGTARMELSPDRHGDALKLTMERGTSIFCACGPGEYTFDSPELGAAFLLTFYQNP